MYTQNNASLGAINEIFCDHKLFWNWDRLEIENKSQTENSRLCLIETAQEKQWEHFINAIRFVMCVKTCDIHKGCCGIPYASHKSGCTGKKNQQPLHKSQFWLHEQNVLYESRGKNISEFPMKTKQKSFEYLRIPVDRLQPPVIFFLITLFDTPLKYSHNNIMTIKAGH